MWLVNICTQHRAGLVFVIASIGCQMGVVYGNTCIEAVFDTFFVASISRREGVACGLYFITIQCFMKSLF